MATDPQTQAGFGRRAGPPSVTVPPPVVETKRPKRVKKDPDPELAAWAQARAGKRRMTWLFCGLLVLGGPLSLFLPEGMAQIGGFGLLGFGGLGLLGRMRKTKRDEL